MKIKRHASGYDWVQWQKVENKEVEVGAGWEMYKVVRSKKDRVNDQ